ncbi:uncharacterized protein VICG_02016 [Vittaforma corneae ATCC 50505]|uniref:Cytoplasmic tRNA 2-thiolation protein 2 n=1 Tax=Vittaforma corneae (strain ATCC 50505) TaxID=993615 RepID=L2GKV1_VITCO|nr:uncharacterized protein VICG_02016 [Vittaforma corneae ATCC 50505]ELA40927.1 hypothetical protein VICG_02016 [Vittaforma corneae ATCC 50505]
MSGCSKCKSAADVKINVLKYCNQCFLSFFELKVQRNLHKLHSNSSILIYLSDSPSSLVAIEFLNKTLSGRKFKKLCIFCRNSLLFKTSIQFVDAEFSPENEYSLKRQSSDVIQYCLENSYDVLLYAESMNQAITGSLLLLCKGQGLDAVSYCSRNQYDSLNIVNIFEGVKQKEISYYLYLKGINDIDAKPRDVLKNKDIPVRVVIDKFISKLDEKNELAVFNIKNTFKKLYKSE